MKKTVTEKVLQANRCNATRSRGPITVKGKNTVRKNAMVHGILAKVLMFKNDEERQDFEAFFENLKELDPPTSPIEAILVEEVAVCWHRAKRALRWEQRIRSQQNPATQVVLGALKANSDVLPIKHNDALEKSSGWDCREVILKINNGARSLECGLGEDQTREQQGVELRAKFTNQIGTVLKYQAAVKRDLYRAIGALRALQKERN